MILIITAIILAFLSHLLVIRLGSHGASRGQLVALVAELWISVALIIGVLYLTRLYVGPVPGGADGLSSWLQGIGALPPARLALLTLLLVVAIAVFVHLQASIRHATRDLPDDRA